MAVAERIVELSGSCGAFEKFMVENINYYIRFVVVKGKPDVSHMCRYDWYELDNVTDPPIGPFDDLKK